MTLLLVLKTMACKTMPMKLPPIIRHNTMGRLWCQGSSCIWSNGIVANNPFVSGVLFGANEGDDYAINYGIFYSIVFNHRTGDEPGLCSLCSPVKFLSPRAAAGSPQLRTMLRSTVRSMLASLQDYARFARWFLVFGNIIMPKTTIVIVWLAPLACLR